MTGRPCILSTCDIWHSGKGCFHFIHKIRHDTRDRCSRLKRLLDNVRGSPDTVAHPCHALLNIRLLLVSLAYRHLDDPLMGSISVIPVMTAPSYLYTSSRAQEPRRQEKHRGRGRTETQSGSIFLDLVDLKRKEEPRILLRPLVIRPMRWRQQARRR